MGGQLSRPEITSCVHRVGSNIINAGSANLNGLRTTNEDSHIMHRPINNDCGRYIFSIFDGHGGSNVANFLPDQLKSRLLDLPENLDDQDDAITQIFIDLDNEMLKQRMPAGSTAIVVIIDVKQVVNSYEYKCTVCNLGDSRCMICRNNNAIFITEDHKPSNPEEEERINNGGGFVRCCRVNGELAISRAFGDFQYKKNINPRKNCVISIPDITHHILAPNDVIILVCDGVYESNFSNDQIVNFISSALTGVGRDSRFTNLPLDLGNIATQVCKNAIYMGSTDNLSNMIIRIGDNGTNAMKLYGSTDCVPGLPPILKCLVDITAFEAMAKKCGFTPVELLQRRYFLLKNRSQCGQLKEIYFNAFEFQNEQDLENQLKWFYDLIDQNAGKSNLSDDSYDFLNIDMNLNCFQIEYKKALDPPDQSIISSMFISTVEI